ncbi:MAG: DUF938 domain-containing protein [bacterium]
MELPFSQACEKNKRPILEVLRHWLTDGDTVLEVGSGTGQHAVFFAENLPGIVWQCADQLIYHSAINQRVADSNLPNLLPAIELEVTAFDWALVEANSVFSANTAHIMPWSAVKALFAGVSRAINDGVFVLYGPFNRDGKFTSDSNRQFHESLQRQASHMGVRDDVELCQLAQQHGLELADDVDMPSNNRILVWKTKS